ncbi:MAG: alanine racemase [Gemmatimonadaceae bacterium]
MDPDRRRAWVEVDLGALKRNAATMAARAGVPIVPMVKADAYGLGAAAVVRALETLSPWGYGVATVTEGEELRAMGIDRHILVVSPLLEWDFATARAARLTPVLSDVAAIAAWERTGGGPWHLGIDTGMHRAGVPWWQVEQVVPMLRAHPPEGACTHFHSAERDDGTRELQEQRFRAAISALPIRPRFLHAENSPGIERQSPSPWDLARPGVFLYGVGGDTGSDATPRPVVQLKGRIVSLRDVPAGETVSYGGTFHAHDARRVATVSLGYADGYRRAFSNRGVALVHGRRVPIAGLVTMDMTMLDVTDVECRLGDVATFIGCDGEDTLDVNEVARTADMSPYEVLTGLRQRLPRVYVERDA